MARGWRRKGKRDEKVTWQFGGGERGCLGQHFATLRKFRSLSCGLFTPISGNTPPRKRIADGQFDAIAEIKAVVAAIYVSCGTIIVDGIIMSNRAPRRLLSSAKVRQAIGEVCTSLIDSTQKPRQSVGGSNSNQPCKLSTSIQ